MSRPFEGMASECDLIALRELVPAATAPLRLADSVKTDRSVLLCTLLPMAAPALVRQDGTVWLALQVQHQFGDPSRDLGAVLEKALEAILPLEETLRTQALRGITQKPVDWCATQLMGLDVERLPVVARARDVTQGAGAEA